MNGSKIYRRIICIIALFLLCVGTLGCGSEEAQQPEETIVRGSGLEELEEVEEVNETDVEIVRAEKPTPQYVTDKVDGTKLASEDYLYRNLLSGPHKQAYDLLHAGLIEAQSSIAMTGVRVSSAELKTIFRYIYYDNPDIFWMTGSYKCFKNGDGTVTKVEPGYNALKNDIPKYKAEIEKAAADALADMWSLSEPIDRVKYAHDYLTNTVVYDTGSANNQNLYSALVEKKSVCAGYSKAFQYMMQKVGIRCAYITGGAIPSPGAAQVNHAWNILVLNGEYYAMDVTWDDPVGVSSGKYYYDYFNVTDTVIGTDHARDEYSAAIPAAGGVAFNYANAYKSNKAGTDFGSIQGTLPEGYGTGAGFLGDAGADVESNPYLN